MTCDTVLEQKLGARSHEVKAIERYYLQLPEIELRRSGRRFL